MASGGNQQPSFKTNVNRMKTKRWVEAKSYTYDGDDWGDADEYDEYDGYDEPAQASAPAPAPSGSRQPSAGYAQDPRQQMAPFPGAPQPPYMQQQVRNASPGRPPYAQDPRDRSGSFDRGDERRNFSGPAAPGSPTVAPLRTAYGSAPRNQSPMGAQQRTASSPQYGPPGPAGRPMMEQQTRGASGPLPPPSAPFAADTSGRSWSMSSSGSRSEALGQRRDYSPSTGGHAPQAQGPPASRPPRKSSLSLAAAPAIPLTQPAVNTEMSAPSGSTTETAPGPESPPPKLIRPADIYKRVAEEKERERMSQESGRPSMSDIMREREGDVAETDSADNVGPTLRPRKHTLDTVAERKSEYGNDGVLGQMHPVAQQARAPAPSTMTEEQRKRFSTSPQLPDFASGFGDDWMSGFGSNNSGNPQLTTSKAEQGTRQDPAVREADVAQQASGLGLSHKPSEGFRSVVHQAFDEPVQANTSAGSEFGRSDTTSTNAISPIITRSSSKEDPKAKATDLRAVNMGAIAEEGNIGRPYGNGSPNALRRIDGKAQPTDDLPPPGFVPGHRRNTSVPSPGNSPARQPKLEVKNIPQSEEGAEFGAATPIEERETRRRAESAVKASQIQSVVESLAQKAREEPLPQTSSTRAESPTKGRVRDLVDKAESADSSRRNSASSLTAGLRPSQDRADSFRPQLPGGWNSYVTNPPVSSPERGVSPRPASGPSSRPGTSDEYKPSSLPGAAVNPPLLGQGAVSPSQSSIGPHVASHDIDIEPTTRKRSLVQGEATDSIDPSRDPLAAAKAAGAALVGAFTAAAGSDKDHENEPSPDQYGAARGQHGAFEKGGTTMYPESIRPLMPPSVDSAATSILATPRGYSPTRISEERSDEDLPAVAPLRQRAPGVPGSPTAATSSSAFPSSAAPLPVSVESPNRDSPLDEHDELRRDIVRQLTPNAPAIGDPASHTSTPTPPANRYQAYQPPSQQTPTSTGTALKPAPQALPSSAGSALQPPRQAKPRALKHKFSWEGDSGGEDEPEPAAAPSAASAAQADSSTALAPASIVAPTQTITTVTNDPVPGLDAGTTFQSSFMSPATPSVSTRDIGAQELPASRISTDEQEPNRFSPEFPVTLSPKLNHPAEIADGLKSPPPPPVPSKNDESPMSPSPDSQSIEQQQFQPPSQGARQRGQTLTGNQVQVPAFREILAMKSPDDRLRVYRSTQDTFANMNTGLTNWMQAMGEKHPEHKPLLETSGNFMAPTPGLPAALRPAQNSSQASGSGSGFSGLRKAGASAAPSMGDASAALKSAGRDTKKLAKGLFAKGRSKFGRDKGSSKLASFANPSQKYQPYRPDAGPPPPQQYVPYRAGQSGPQQVFNAAAPTDANSVVAPTPVNVAAVSPQPNAPRHIANQKSLPAVPAESPAADAVSRPSDVSDMTGSVDEDRMGEIPILLPPMLESPVKPVKPVLQQRLTIHQKDIAPFEVNFPGDIEPDVSKGQGGDATTDIPPVPPLPTQNKPGTPMEEEDIPDLTTPRQNRFPTRTQSLSAGRTLDPGIEHFNTTPSWLNFDPANSPAHSDFYGLGSPSNKSSKSSPMDVRSKRASLQVPLQSSENKRNMTGQDAIAEEGEESMSSTAGTEDRPFSFINFSTRSDMDFSLNEDAYRIHSRQSSVITDSTGDYDPSRPSTHDDSIEQQISRDDEFEETGTKPLPNLPNEAARAQRIALGGGPYTTMPVRPTPKMSLFPQPISRPGTREREPDPPQNDYKPYRPQGYGPSAAATMPVGNDKPQKHKRHLSGANLLQRALTAGISTIPNQIWDRNIVKAEKTDKKRRRLSGLNLLGKPKASARRVPIEETTPPSTSRAPDGGIGDLATNVQAFEQHLPRPNMQRANAPDPIHVAPIEGYYSPEGDATQSPMTSPIPNTHIASQFNDGSPRALPRSSTSPMAPINHQASNVAQQQPVPQPRWPSRSTSAFNESNNILSNSNLKAAPQQTQYSPQPGKSFPPRAPHAPQPQPQPHQPQPVYQAYSPRPPPPGSPPTTQLPSLPQVSTTLQREATLRTVPSSPPRAIDPSQLNPNDAIFTTEPSTLSTSSSANHPDIPLDRHSLDAFPRPPSARSNASFSVSNQSPNNRSPNSRSPSGQLSVSHSPSASVSTTRRSRGPSLSVDTNLANEGRQRPVSKHSGASGSSQGRASTEPQAQAQNVQEQNQAQNRHPARASNQDQSHGQDPHMPEVIGLGVTISKLAESAQFKPPSATSQPLVVATSSAPTAATAASTQPNSKPTSSPHSANIPSNLAALQALEQSYPTPKPRPDANSSEAVAPSRDPGETDDSIQVGSATKMTIQPATLRAMRRREIELGGETRVNSPMTEEQMPMPVLKVGGEGGEIMEDDVENGGERDGEDEESEDGKDETQDGKAGEGLLKAGARDGDPEGEGEDRIVMSATSFPGQEWNPYEQWA